MPQKAMSFPECIEFLKEAEYGFLNMSMYGQPYTVPVNFVYDERELIFIHSKTEGQKMDYLAFNPNVCLAACRVIRKVAGEKPCSNGYRYESVLVFGTTRLIEDREEKKKVLDKFVEKYQESEMPRLEDHDLEDEVIDKVAILEISFKEVFGKKNVDTEDSGA